MSEPSSGLCRRPARRSNRCRPRHFCRDGWITKREYRDVEAAWISLQLEADEARAQLASLQRENWSTG